MATIAEFTVASDAFPLGYLFDHIPDVSIECGAIVILELILTSTTTASAVALGFAFLGILGMLIGASLIGLQTGSKQRRIRDRED